MAGVIRPPWADAAMLLLRDRFRGVLGTLNWDMVEGVMAGDIAKVLSVLEGRPY